MKLYDTNLLIYFFQPDYDFLQADLLDTNVFVSAITKLEVLGFPSISEPEKAYFERLFQLINILPVDESVIEEAINLRQRRKMSIGDSIIAATAKVKNLDIYTRNTSDFKWITGLRVVDPMV